MDSHPAAEHHQETPNERHNAVALTVFAVIVLVLAALGGNNNLAGEVWLAFCAGVLGMSATFEGIPHEHWRRSAAVFTAGVVLIMLCMKLFSLDPSFIVYKVVSYIILVAGFVTLAIGLKGYARDFSISMVVTAAMVLIAIVTVAAALLSLVTRTISFDFATSVLAVCSVAFAAAVTVTALNIGGAGANVGSSGGWQPKQG
jgi:hypothetical protein